MSALADSVHAARLEQQRAAGERFHRTAPEREANLAARQADGVQVHDTMERLEARAERLAAQREVPFEAFVKVALTEVGSRRLAYERILGESNNLQSWSFLPRGSRAAATVARISSQDNGREIPLGTGFLVSPRLLMTNNHVLPDASAAGQVVVEFSAEVDIDNRPVTSTRYRLDPARFFVTDPRLDMSLVLLEPGGDGVVAGERFGWNGLIRQQGKIVVGEAVNIVGHPMGRLKEIAIRENRVQLLLDDFVHYSTDTEPGNSGSPVFNDQWEVVALHHAGVPKTDEQGNVLRKDDRVWEPGDGDDAVAWTANEGARVSVLLEHLAGLDLDPLGRELRSELMPDDAAPRRVTRAATPPLVTPGALVTTAALDVPRPLPLQRETTRRGIAGRDDSPVHLVLLHGRSQQGKDPARLRSGWVAGLNAGLTQAGLMTVDPKNVWFPYYGDRLAQLLAGRESAPEPVQREADTATSLAPSEGDPARQVYEELLERAAARAGMPEDLLSPEEVAAEEGLGRRLGSSVVGRLQRQLSWVSARSGLDDRAIAVLFRDVAAYLGRSEVREAVLRAVLESFPTRGSVVLVSHSLGTVVAADLLTRVPAGVDVRLLVTAGSPLGLDAVTTRLLEPRIARPGGVASWVNAWCPADPVAIGCPLRPAWGTDHTEVVTDNDKDRAHDIEEYLGDPAVAAPIGEALSAVLVR